MKTNFIKAVFLLSPFSFFLLPAFAQSPQRMSYQAVIRNPTGQLVVNAQIGMRVSILQGSVSGTEVFKEIYNPNPMTNANGLVTIEIGNGIPLTGTFAAIDWSAGPYFIKTETDPAGGTNYTIIGASQLLSVPYAMHAKTADSISGGVVETDPVFGASVAAGITGADTAGWNQAFIWGDHAQQGYLTQELQVLSISNDTIFLTGGSFAVIPPGFSGSYHDLSSKPSFPDSISTYGFSGNYIDLAGKPVLSTVATSGSYADLNYKPVLWDSTYASIKDKPTLSPVAASGSYSDLNNKPNIPDSISTYGFSGNYNDLSNKPALSTVATTGSYTDLSNQPALWDSTYASIKDKPALSPVATSGNYSDLSNRPNIPDSISTYGFSGNYIDLASKPALSTVATSGSYTDLSNQPALWDSSYASIKDKPALSPVATSGNYSDLSNQPNIPDSISTYGFSGNYNDLSNKPSLSTVATTGSYSDLSNQPALWDSSWASIKNSPGKIGDFAGDMDNNRITNLSNPINNQDAVTKSFVTLSVSTAGDTLFFGTEQWVIIPGISYTNNTVNNTFIDPRDSNSYRIVTIGAQTWMAQNLRYLPFVVGPLTGSQTLQCFYVYGYDGTDTAAAKATSNYSNYGVLYNWLAAMNGTSSSVSNPSGVQGVCPVGWHLPSTAEWTQLTDYIGSVPGLKLKEKGTAHWNSPNIGADNATGFTALPGGLRQNNGVFLHIGLDSYWWSASEYDPYNANLRYIFGTMSSVGNDYNNKVFGFSVRCLKN